MPIKGTSKEKRQYQKIKNSAQRSGRYGKRAKEVAARTVMKQRSKRKKASSSRGRSRSGGRSRRQGSRGSARR